MKIQEAELEATLERQNFLFNWEEPEQLGSLCLQVL